MKCIRQTQCAKKDNVSCAAKFEVRLCIGGARTRVPCCARVDRLDDEPCPPLLAGALEHEQCRLDDLRANPVAGQTRELNVDHA